MPLNKIVLPFSFLYYISCVCVCIYESMCVLVNVSVYEGVRETDRQTDRQIWDYLINKRNISKLIGYYSGRYMKMIDRVFNSPCTHFRNLF